MMEDAGIGDIAADALKAAWGMDVPLGPPHIGISRLSWRAGTSAWLYRVPAIRANDARVEANLLSILSGNSGITVPSPILTREGRNVADAYGGAWTLCEHIYGDRLADASSVYMRLVEILADIHQKLIAVDTRLVPVDTSILQRVNLLFEQPTAHLSVATVSAIAWLKPRIELLADMRPHLIHGDFGIPNVLVDGDSERGFAVLDWELASVDPPIFDLAQIAFGRIAFSDHLFGSAELARLIGQYSELGGDRFSTEALLTALVAGRVGNLGWLQERVDLGESALIESVRFLEERMERVFVWMRGNT